MNKIAILLIISILAISLICGCSEQNIDKEKIEQEKNEIIENDQYIENSVNEELISESDEIEIGEMI
jgi:sensor domain CHASE-containing protein